MSILDECSIGACLRVYARKHALVQSTAESVLAAARALEAMEINGRRVFCRIIILVVADKRRDFHDCGRTTNLLKRELGLPRKGSRIVVRTIKYGDLYVVALNDGISELRRNGADYALIVSHEAGSYIHPDVIGQMLEAFEHRNEKGERICKVAGLAIDELAESVLKGRIANTFAMWDIGALQGAGGGFSKMSAQGFSKEPTTRIRTWNEKDGFHSYDLAGVEEIFPLIQLVNELGPCIRAIKPCIAGHWNAPDPIKDPQGYEDFKNKLATKEARQRWWANAAFSTLEVLEGGTL